MVLLVNEGTKDRNIYAIVGNVTVYHCTVYKVIMVFMFLFLVIIVDRNDIYISVINDLGASQIKKLIGNDSCFLFRFIIQKRNITVWKEDMVLLE